MFVGRKLVADTHQLAGIEKVLGFRCWDGFIPSPDIICNLNSLSGGK